jgi:hypothetical protein
MFACENVRQRSRNPPGTTHRCKFDPAPIMLIDAAIKLTPGAVRRSVTMITKCREQAMRIGNAEPVEEGREISWMGLDREWAPQLPTGPPEDFGKGIDFE